MDSTKKQHSQPVYVETYDTDTHEAVWYRDGEKIFSYIEDAAQPDEETSRHHHNSMRATITGILASHGIIVDYHEVADDASYDDEVEQLKAQHVLTDPAKQENTLTLISTKSQKPGCMEGYFKGIWLASKPIVEALTESFWQTLVEHEIPVHREIPAHEYLAHPEKFQPKDNTWASTLGSRNGWAKSA